MIPGHICRFSQISSWRIMCLETLWMSPQGAVYKSNVFIFSLLLYKCSYLWRMCILRNAHTIFCTHTSPIYYKPLDNTQPDIHTLPLRLPSQLFEHSCQNSGNSSTTIVRRPEKTQKTRSDCWADTYGWLICSRPTLCRLDLHSLHHFFFPPFSLLPLTQLIHPPSLSNSLSHSTSSSLLLQARSTVVSHQLSKQLREDLPQPHASHVSLHGQEQ